MRKAAELVVCVLVCQAVGVLGAAATIPNLAGWYAGLHKPSWTPPGWLFGPVWTLLYLMMAVAFWQVWQERSRPGALTALKLFGGQLAFNALWSWLFFGLRNPGLGLADILLLWASLMLTLRAFWAVRPGAGGLLVPYAAWVSFAAALNFAIWRLNP